MANKLLVVGGIGLAGVLAYIWYKNKQEGAGAPAASAPASSGGSSSTLLPSTGGGSMTQAPSTGTSSAGAFTQAQAQQVANYFQGYLNACDVARWNANVNNFTADEWAGLEDLYFNDWLGGQGTTPARTSFWNDWRSKYNILTGASC
jgi:hypothetical protein